MEISPFLIICLPPVFVFLNKSENPLEEAFAIAILAKKSLESALRDNAAEI